MAVHELPLEQRTLHGHFSRDLEPILEIDPGDSVRISVPNHAWDLSPDEEIESRSPEIDTGHPLAGPIEVRGAKAGQTLAVRVDEVEPGEWGISHGGERPRRSLGAGRRRRPRARTRARPPAVPRRDGDAAP